MLGRELDNAKNVVLAHDEEILAVIMDFLAGILAIKHDVAHGDGHQVAVFAGANSHYLAALRLLFGCVRDDDAALGFFIGGRRLDDNTVCYRFHTRVNYFVLVKLLNMPINGILYGNTFTSYFVPQW